MNSFFRSFNLKSLHLKNRFVMAPMTRSFSPGGVPGKDVASYYVRRAIGQVGMIVSEGTVIARPASSNDPNIPHFYGEEALKGWKNVIDEVHAAGGVMAPQIWHMGVMAPHASGWLPSTPFEGPSGMRAPGQRGGHSMTDAEVEKAVHSYGRAAAEAKRLGFDAVEIHGAHGYLIDQFFWDQTNLRSDVYGGKTLAERTRFGRDVVIAVRRAVGPDFPIIMRLSQWKPTDYSARLAYTEKDLEAWLAPLAKNGVDIFHCSQRRFWEPEFEGSDLNFAGWAKKITGKPTITVGSVGLDGEFTSAFKGHSAKVQALDELERRFTRGDFDLVAVGRSLLSDPDWVNKIQEGRMTELKGFDKDDLKSLK